jgi:hypothetical protein
VTGSGVEALLSEVAADPRLGPVYEYWRLLAGDDIPAFSQFDPARLPAATLGYLTLLDVIDGGGTFCVRLVGTVTMNAVGSNVTGTNLATIGAGEILKAALVRYRAVLMHRRPVADIVEYAMPCGSSFKTRLLTLPFSADGLLINRLLGVYSPVPSRAAPSILRKLVIPSNFRVRRSQVVL